LERNIHKISLALKFSNKIRAILFYVDFEWCLIENRRQQRLFSETSSFPISSREA